MFFIVDSYIFFNHGDDTQGKMGRTYPHDGLEARR